jgi:hypothetical protein
VLPDKEGSQKKPRRLRDLFVGSKAPTPLPGPTDQTLSLPPLLAAASAAANQEQEHAEDRHGQHAQQEWQESRIARGTNFDRSDSWWCHQRQKHRPNTAPRILPVRQEVLMPVVSRDAQAERALRHGAGVVPGLEAAR